MTKIFKYTVFVLAIFLSISYLSSGAKANETDNKLNELNQKIEEYQREVERLNQTANTLNNQISQYNAQINLTEAKIEQTEQKIGLLGGRIGQLENSLESLTKAFAERAARTYKLTRVNNPYFMLITSDNLNDAVNSYHYLSRIQSQDQDLLARLQDARDTYETEKVDQEDLQGELESQQAVLGSQKQAKAQLLSVTRNDERRYQQLLAQARAEREAIQAIISGRGNETEVGSVNEGDRIASIIPSASACSTGAHLHLEVVKDKAAQNPFGFLSPRSLNWDNADPAQNGTGSWAWPLNDPIRITQSFGRTSYSSIYAGGIHTGVDMVNNANLTVKAIKKGTLYRGGMACGGGTLRYVKVDHDEDEYATYYLHVNY